MSELLGTIRQENTLPLAMMTSLFQKSLGVDAAYRLISEAGFDAVDAGFDEIFSIWKRERSFPMDVAFFSPWKDAAKKYGLDNYQAHAPFPSIVPDDTEDYNDYIMACLRQSIRVSDYIGCRKLVIHPFFFSYTDAMSPEDEWNCNIENYSKLIPVAQQYGVQILLENMFVSYRAKRFEAACSDVDMAAKYIDTLNGIAGGTGKRFGFCLDTGHMLLLGKDLRQVMNKLGDRIEAFHVHDNNTHDDEHLPPYFGRQDWQKFIQGLADIHYHKTVSFESGKFWNTVDHEMVPAVLRFNLEAGRYFTQKAAELEAAMAQK